MRVVIFLLFLSLSIGFEASAGTSREAYQVLLSKLQREKQSRWFSTTLNTFPYLDANTIVFHGVAHESVVQSPPEWTAFVEAASREISATNVGREIAKRHAQPLAHFHPEKYERHFGLWYTQNTPKPEDSVNLLSVYGYTFNNNYSLLMLDGRDLSYDSFMSTFIHEFMATEDGKLAVRGKWEENNNVLAELTKNLPFPFRVHHVQLSEEARDILASPLVAYGLAAMRDYEMENLLNGKRKKTGACSKTLRHVIDDLWPAWDLIWQYMAEVAEAESLTPQSDQAQALAVFARHIKYSMAVGNKKSAQAITEEDLTRFEKATVRVDGQVRPLCDFFAEPLIAPENAFLGAGPRPRGSGWLGDGE